MTNSINGLPTDLQHLAVEEPKRNASTELGQDAFLDLMLTQLQHQDPLNPMESGDFLGQLAQFGTVNGITELQGSFSALANQLQSNQALQASTLVGRTVTVPSNINTHEQGQEFKAAADLNVPVDSLIVSIHDSAGQIVRQLDLGAQPSGIAHFSWDGINTDGQQAPSGTYRVSAQGRVGDDEFSFNTLVSAKVESVTLSKNGQEPMLNLGAFGLVSMGDISELL